MKAKSSFQISLVCLELHLVSSALFEDAFADLASQRATVDFAELAYCAFKYLKSDRVSFELKMWINEFLG